MKKLHRYLIAGVFLSSLFTACKKIDDLHPYDQIVVANAFTSVKDAASWDVGFYAEFRGLQNGEYMQATDVQTDELNATLDYGNNYGSMHRWGQYFLADDYTLADNWNNPYNAIADVNVALAGFKNIKPASTAETSQLNQYTGDALLARAFYYHKLILRYAKPYETSSAATDPGVPLLTTYDSKVMPARATVKQVYDQIIADITQAKTLLTGVSGSQGAATFTIDAAVALEARVRLCMHDWDGAYNAANSLISAGSYPLINNLTNFQAYWTNDTKQESILQLYVSTTQPPNANNIYINYNASNKDNDPLFIPTQKMLNLYTDGDIRKKTYFINTSATISAVKYNLYLVNKYPGNPVLFTTNVSNYQNAPKVFRIAEMYCIAAEAAANNSNAAGALTALNALRQARGTAAVTGLSGTALIQAVQDERTREFAFEGFHLDDLKRWHQGFTGRTPQNANAIQSGAAYDGLSIPADNAKFVWGIPTNDVTVNPNIKQNPGW
ncbi:MAG: RagB/SusD family nutrient uptake outer membrane protein [Sphingobacteriaceae bacterium]|nr:MAG: RagB/SusD family nutrient uptake outer membrane protein [Sphingobacteriaceae bacterium]